MRVLTGHAMESPPQACRHVTVNGMIVFSAHILVGEPVTTPDQVGAGRRRDMR
jgi:hypothetical protein